MRLFGIALVVVTCSAFIAFAVVMSNVSFFPYAPAARPAGTTTPPGPAPQELKVTVASAHGWDVITQGEQVVGEVRPTTGTCADPFAAMKVVPHSGHTRVTLEVRPQPQQQLVITAVRLRVDAVTPLHRKAKYLYHCAGPAEPAATRVQVDAGKQTVYAVAGSFPQQVPVEGYRQDIEVEVHGDMAADWQVEVDYTLDGVTRTQLAPPQQGLVTEPRPADADGHFVWCGERWRPGERC
ncbi:hypothetical protein [Lentzea flava]|uniref:Uncharacterized protein n=1 Tax=Lentzea flava TaxID=103732 RepID=A0ABQ2UXT1_9PSEU|nr:hypothetical protein [Lentzea flava]MCP2201911.1 hypothetical protein [Lentzea flava]GGU56190.1 hypothetical protein GCM10010178_55760 [Lentzea flava]